MWCGWAGFFFHDCNTLVSTAMHHLDEAIFFHNILSEEKGF